MKAIILIFLLIIQYPFLYAQSSIDLKKDVKLISVPRGAITNVPRPSPFSKIIKVRTKSFDSNVELKVYIEEYVKGSKVPNPMEMIYWDRGNKDAVFTYELIPDLIDMQYLHLFLNAPGVTCHREKRTEFPKYFECCVYEKPENEEINTKIPVILVYEDDFKTGKNKKIVEKYLVNDLLTTGKNEELLPQIERYFFVFYQISKTLNE